MRDEYQRTYRTEIIIYKIITGYRDFQNLTRINGLEAFAEGWGNICRYPLGAGDFYEKSQNTPFCERG
jgi:hypothetical protein